MQTDVQQLVHNEYAQTCVRVKARQLLLRDDFSLSEREDVEQDLWVYLLTQTEHFDPARSSLNTFIDRLVNVAAAMMIRARECEKRADGFQTESLDADRGTGSKKKSRRSYLSPDDGARRTGGVPTDDIAQLEDREAMEFALGSMAPEVRDVCQRLMDGQEPATIARELGISRFKVRKLIASARHQFVQAGFDD